ncbi:uncharacterized protein UBRO2_01452 [Ustilago bromivora]|uniref:Uncharacterized protein n=1 Tax=Ustilago bromivora TaxID=307758 RepID=A0A8H8QJ13_9BASI|nr:uncharacterized protein UBRO2_01452 [Ustilago bromivora]
MPPRICDPDTESSDLSDGPNKERAPTAPQRQMLIGTETPLPYNSDDDDNNSDEMHYNIDTISNLNPEVLKGMLIKLTKHNKARDSNTYKKPSHCSNFRQRLSHTHDALKEAPKLTTKDWYAWNPRFRGILSNWPAAMKHLDGTVAPGDKKYNHTLDGKLCTILQSSALLAGNNNINYLFVRPANSEPWKLHNLYCRLKKDLTKMEKIAKSTLLNEVRKILMFQADVCKLIMNINEHWAKAESMGHALTEILKVKMLIDQARAGNIRSAQANLAEGQVKNEEAYHSEPDMAFGRDIPIPGPTDAVFEYPADGIDDASEPNSPTTSSDRASDGSTDKTYRFTMPSEVPPLPNKLDQSIQDRAFSEHLSMQKAQYYHNKFAATHEMSPWLHPTTLAILLQTYPRMLPPAAKMHRFQEKLQCNSKLADIGDLPTYNASAYMVSATNLKPLVKEALNRPNQIHWCEAI